jgi:hypothetical protein
MVTAAQDMAVHSDQIGGDAMSALVFSMCLAIALVTGALIGFLLQFAPSNGQQSYTRESRSPTVLAAMAPFLVRGKSSPNAVCSCKISGSGDSHHLLGGGI